MPRSRCLNIHLFLSFGPLDFFHSQSNWVFDIVSDLIDAILLRFGNRLFRTSFNNLCQAHGVVESDTGLTTLIRSKIAAVATLEARLISLEWWTTLLEGLLSHHLCSNAVKTLSDPIICICNTFEGLVLVSVWRVYVRSIFERRGAVSEKEGLRISWASILECVRALFGLRYRSLILDLVSSRTWIVKDSGLFGEVCAVDGAQKGARLIIRSLIVGLFWTRWRDRQMKRKALPMCNWFDLLFKLWIEMSGWSLFLIRSQIVFNEPLSRVHSGSQVSLARYDVSEPFNIVPDVIWSTLVDSAILLLGYSRTWLISH